nr:hypothetical protein BgiMline_031898 [Biomphalaria glabrata]
MNGMPGLSDYAKCNNVGIIDANITVNVDKVRLEDAGMYKCSLKVHGNNYEDITVIALQQILKYIPTRARLMELMDTKGDDDEADEESRGSEVTNVGLKQKVLLMITVCYCFNAFIFKS